MTNVWMGSFRVFINVAKFTMENEEWRDGKTKVQNLKVKDDIYFSHKEQEINSRVLRSIALGQMPQVLGGSTVCRSGVDNRSPCERLAWFNIHGVLLHLAGNETFDSVGRCFGKVVHASQRQTKDNFLLYDCVVIVEEGKRFRVWVEEERGDWTPDLLENQHEQEEEDGDWDLMSEAGDYGKKPYTAGEDSVRRSPEFGDVGNKDRTRAGN
ncbi:hypothetical protein Hanom_Chr05g00386191 [Helianthus anomalus]